MKSVNYVNFYNVMPGIVCWWKVWCLRGNDEAILTRTDKSTKIVICGIQLKAGKVLRSWCRC